MTDEETAPTADQLVWYASYGSNLDRDRFLAYLTGGMLADAATSHRGARNNAEPIDDQAFALPHQLFFGGASKRWGGGGVAFLDRTNTGSTAHARAYLITAEQFEDVFAQENGQEAAAIDLDAIERDGALEMGSPWYGLILQCGTIDDRPVLTFTSPTPGAEWERTPPGPLYLRRLATGLRISHNLDAAQIAAYFLSCPGVRPEWDEASLRTQVLDQI